jgi:hypothetical protein
MLSNVRSALEIFYFIGGIVVAVASVVALQQLSILKKDIRTRNERAAKEKAIEYCTRYLTTYVRLDAEWMQKRSDAKLPNYEGPMGDFGKESIPLKCRATARARFAALAWLPAINELAAISAPFVHGVADEQVGFSIIGRTFCAAVELDYDIIALGHSEEVHPHYESIVGLYRVWKPRLTSAELEHARRELEAALGKVKTSKIPAIGAE